MPIFDLYGTSEDLQTARNNVERALNLTFEERDSEYHGGIYYLHGDTAGEHLLLKRNIDPVDNEPAELDFRDQAVVMYVNDSKSSEKIFDLLATGYAGLSRLRHEKL